MPVLHSGTRRARRGRGGSGRAPQMAPGVGPDYTSQEPLPGPAAALGTGDKTVFLDFIKAVTRGRAFLEPNWRRVWHRHRVGDGTGAGLPALPGDGGIETPGATRARPDGVQPLHPNFSGSHCHGTPRAEQSRGSQCLHKSRGWETLAGARPSHAGARLQFLPFGCFCGLAESCDCAGLDVTVAEPSAGSSRAVPVCGLALGGCVHAGVNPGVNPSVHPSADPQPGSGSAGVHPGAGTQPGHDSAGPGASQGTSQQQ